MKKLFLAVLMSVGFSGLSADSYDSCGFFNNVAVTADFLWWNARIPNDEVVVTETDSSGQIPVNTNTSYIQKYDWKPGFDIGIAYQDCFCGNEVILYANWTYFRTNANFSIVLAPTATDTFSLIDGVISVSTNTPGVLTTYTNSSSFLYERLDIGAMSCSYQCCNFAFQPSLALTGLYVREGFDSSAVGPDPLGNGSSIGRYHGIGVTIGAHVSYPLIDCLSLYSHSEFSALWGKSKFNSNGRDLAVFLASSTRINTKNYWTGRVVFGQQVGMQFSAKAFALPVEFRLAWEFLYLPEMYSHTIARSGDVAINGLVAGLKIGF